MDLRRVCCVIFVCAVVIVVSTISSVTAGDIVQDDDSAPKKPGCENDFVLELGMADAFNCSELDRVLSEVEKVEKWKQYCEDIVGTSVGDVNPLLSALLKIKHSLDRSLYIYDKSRGCKVRGLCMWCSSDYQDQEFLTCSTCKDCYHLRCLGPIPPEANHATVYICPYCRYMDSGSVSWNGDRPMRFGGKRPELKMLRDLLSKSEDFSVWIEEREILQQLVEQALACKAWLAEIVDHTLAYHDRDLSIVSKKLTIALKALQVAGVFDCQDNGNLDRALARNAWRVRINKLVEGSQRPSIQQIQQHLKEGLALSIPPEDHFWQKLNELKRIGLQWADIAKKVAMDSGVLGLDEVFKLILEGEKLPVHFENELKLLRDRSMLYCICRKPNDRRPMIACDHCDEWYHFDCIKLSSPPKIYICPACKPQTEGLLSTSSVVNQERSTGAKFGDPQTPSPRHTERRRERKKAKFGLKQKMAFATDHTDILRYSSGIDRLLWRNQKPFRRATRKRADFESLSPCFHRQKQT